MKYTVQNANAIKTARELLELLEKLTPDEQRMVLMLIKGYSAGVATTDTA